MDTDGHHLVTWKSGSLGWFRLGEPPIMPKHCKKYQIKGIFMNFRSICCVLQVQAYGDPAQYLECFNLAVLVIHNLAVQVGLKEGGWGSQILADHTQQSWVYFHPKGAKLRIQESQLPTQAENLELLHSEPRILRVLLEVGPYLFPHGMLMKEKMRGLT